MAGEVNREGGSGSEDIKKANGQRRGVRMTRVGFVRVGWWIQEESKLQDVQMGSG